MPELTPEEAALVRHAVSNLLTSTVAQLSNANALALKHGPQAVKIGKLQEHSEKLLHLLRKIETGAAVGETAKG